MNSKPFIVRTDVSSRNVQLAVAITIFYLLLYLLPLGGRALTIPDETRYAEIPREMLATGNWVAPHFNGLRYFEKPPLGYWLNAASISTFGDNPFAVRLPTALAAGLTSLLIFLVGTKMLHDRREAMFAALIHLSFTAVFGIGTFSVLDGMFTLFITAGITTFYLAAGKPDSRRALPFWLISGASLGLAFLTKGFIALAIPVLVMVPWMLWQKKWRTLITQGWIVVAAALIMSLPWSVMIEIREPDFWHYFFWEEHIRRFTADNAQHKAPFYYFIVLLPILAFPWLSLAPAAFCGIVNRCKETNASGLDVGTRRFLYLWLLLPFIFFSISSGKLPTYILPCFPPLALLIAAGLQHYLKQPNIRLFKVGKTINLIVLFILLLALVMSQLFWPDRALYGKHEAGSILVVVVSILIAIIAGFSSLKSTKEEIRYAGIALYMLPIMTITHIAPPEATLQSKSPQLLIQQYAYEITSDAVVIADAYIIGAVDLSLNRQDVYLMSEGELDYGLNYTDSEYRLLKPENFTQLIEKSRNSHEVVVLCSEGCDKRYRNLLPTNAEYHKYGIFEIWIYRKTQKTELPA